MKLDLSTEFCGIKFENPLILASGGLGESATLLKPFLNSGAAAVVTRTIRLVVDPEREKFPVPHLYLGNKWQYLLNAEWGNLRPYTYWLNGGILELIEHGPVILSISGRNIDDCVTLAEMFDKSGVAFFEVNVSCSHSNFLLGRITDDFKHIETLTQQLKKKVKTPIIIKLGWSPILPDIALIAEKNGADVIATTNTIGPGLEVDIETGEPNLGIIGGKGGVSGKSIFPIALSCVHQVVQAVNIPVIGIGGISSYEQVIKMMMVGASAVQIYTEAFLKGTQIFPTIIHDLEEYLMKNNIDKLLDIKGKSIPFLNRPSNFDLIVPQVISDKCTSCEVCTLICPVGAIKMNKVAVIDPDVCIGCGVCVQTCPTQYSAIELPKRSNQ